MGILKLNGIKIMVIICITICIADFIVLFVLGNYYPGYSQLKNTISSLGATISPVSNLISAWWIFIGIVFIFFGIIFRKAFYENPKSSKLASVLIMLYGIGEGIGSGLFKADRIRGEMKPSFIAHDIAGGIGLIAALLLPLVMQKVIEKEKYSRFGLFSKIIFFIGLITIALFTIRFSAQRSWIFDRGLWQRLFLLNLYVYLIAISVIIYNKKNRI
ncbi:DUF998 domain-containing protein [Flavobacterium sp.]|uniref:DUF998 domain-containing protein n=1 Tax=Flavobacterium sp. TaxID=239 RepID=UPI002ED9F93D